MCRHHLTGQAQEDLLQLLQLHLPKKNELPSSLYLFEKLRSGQTDIQIIPTYHHYCPQCYTAIPNSTTTKCPNALCSVEISYESSPYFITVPIADQLKTFLSSKPIVFIPCVCVRVRLVYACIYLIMIINYNNAHMICITNMYGFNCHVSRTRILSVIPRMAQQMQIPSVIYTMARYIRNFVQKIRKLSFH